MIEQVSSAIFGMQRGSAEYKHDLTRTFLRFVLPKATQPTVFLNSKARLQYWMAAEALTEFKDDFSSSKEELLSIQLSAARELQSSQLVRRTQLSIIENQLSKSPKLIDAFRLRTAAALTAYEIEIYLFAISFILIIAASARASMSLYEQRLDPLAKAGDLTWPKIIFKSVWNSPQILTGKVALAVFSFAAGMWLTKAETVTSLFN
ncbi:MAG: hypothetical protein EOP05_01705 [Proteobacteria bacterium]|nr:MAG: hypothetical protein EOP05_01705 [Pseudomonadota bacterium]